MDKQLNHLWEKIDAYQIGAAATEFSFSDRLARENVWKLKFAIRAILEYKRFMFLICQGNQPLTPSDQVDQVWHLHLLYTEDYWKEFCGTVLKREIHHGPTKGGSSEKLKYRTLYQNTLDLYQDVFGFLPPKDIWPSVENRFQSYHFIRIAKRENFIIPKNLKKLLTWKN